MSRRLTVSALTAVLALVPVACGGDDTGSEASSPSTSLPAPTEIPGSALTGDVAFLGAIHTVPVGDLTMAYRQFGTGQDLVMIAGQASPMDTWPASVLEALAQDHRITIYDNRDLGNTTDTAEPFTLPGLADDTAGLIAALGLDRPAVFGWSTGGEIGLLVASRHPDALSSLAITGATVGGPNTTLPPADLIECMGSEDDPCDYFPLLFSDSPAGEDAMNRYVSDYARVPHEDSVPGTFTKYDEAEHAYWSSEEQDFAAITVPVLVMNGEDDPIAPTANAEYIAEQIGDNAQLEIDQGTRHLWFMEHQDRFLTLINDLADT